MKSVIVKVIYVIRYFIRLVLEIFSLADKTDLFIDEKYHSIRIYYGRKCLDVGCGHGDFAVGGCGNLPTWLTGGVRRIGGKLALTPA